MVQTPKRYKSDGSDDNGDYRIDMNSASKKCNKPMMERRRRARINDSLNQLKSLVLQASGKEESNFSKLDKADILEMTVKHIASIQRAGLSGSIISFDTSSNFAGGFTACAKETLGLLSTLTDRTGSSTALQAGLFNHLAKAPCSPNAGTVSPESRHNTAVTTRYPSQRHHHREQQHENYGHQRNLLTQPDPRVRTLGVDPYGRMPQLQQAPLQNSSPAYSSHLTATRTEHITPEGTARPLSSKCLIYPSSSSITSSVIVKKEPQSFDGENDISADYSDSEGSRSPGSDASPESTRSAWRPW